MNSPDYQYCPYCDEYKYQLEQHEKAHVLNTETNRAAQEAIMDLSSELREAKLIIEEVFAWMQDDNRNGWVELYNKIMEFDIR